MRRIWSLCDQFLKAEVTKSELGRMTLSLLKVVIVSERMPIRSTLPS